MKKTKDRPIDRLFSFMDPYKKKYGIAIFFSVIYTLARAANPFLIGLIISELARNIFDKNTAGLASINFPYISKIIAIIFIMGLIDTIGEYIANYLLAEAVQDTTFDIRHQIYEKLNRLPVSFYDTRQQGEILSRVTTDVTVISEAMQQILLRVLSSGLTLIFGVVFMFSLSPFFAMVSLLFYPIIYYTFKHLLAITQPAFDDLQASLGKLNGYTQEYYSSYMVIQLFGQEDEVIKGFDKVNSKLNKDSFKANLLSSTINPILSSITHIFYILLFLILALTVLNKPFILGGVVLAGAMEIGQIQAFIQYIWQASGPIGQITQLSTLFQAAKSSLDRVIEVLDEDEEAHIEELFGFDEDSIKGDIVFEDMKFGYSEDKMLMDGINIDIKSGSTVAVVGPTGAGKTTLINLLMRFYDINSGSIKIDGLDMKDLSKKQTRSLFGVVSQSPWLYSTTIGENIRFGKLDASYEEIIESAKLARVDHFIRTLPDGYRTIINEESSNISQGEKQLITIARALIADPEILILDEATSSVDTRLERLIQEAMEKAMEGRTSFVIAHRLSTIRDADLILVMQHGSIVEQGTHEELMNKDGVYRDLYMSQFM